MQASSSIADRFRTARSDPDFRQVLARLARLGMGVGAGLGVLAVVLYVGINLATGRSVGWSYHEEEVIGLWDKSLLLGLCALAFGLARHLSLRGARLLMTVLVVVGALASVGDDVMSGDTSFSPGYLTFMYLLVVIAVPYRPLQTAGVGVALMVALYGAVEVLPGVFGVPDVSHERGQFIYLTIITVTLAGMSGLLYSIRYGQYLARREAEELHERVRAVEAAKSRFFVNVSHELRTPLTLILGPLADALAGRYGTMDPALKSRLGETYAQTHRLHDLINQLLDLSKLEAGAMPLRMRVHDLSTFAQHQAALFRSAAERREVELIVDVPEDPLSIWFDAEKMQRVLANLLSNALKHTPPGGTIRVRVERASEVTVLAVRDTGKGLAPEVLATVFDRFFSGARVPDGAASTGIGLALVKEIVERHGGRVQVESEPGFGAEFAVYLPLGDAHVAPEDRALAEEPVGAGPLPPVAPRDPAGSEAAPVALERTVSDDAPLVVVADDDGPVRTYLCDVLGSTYRIVEAADGEAAWTLVHEHRPALVVSDVMMPKLDGYALCQRIRADERLAPTPIVLVTARAEEEDRLEGWRTGADAYLAKPFSSDELLMIAENLIEVRHLLSSRVQVPDWMEVQDVAVAAPDAEFLDRVQQVVGQHLGDSNFTVDWLADEVGLSARHLQRRIQDLTRLTAAGFIKAMRLEHAARLLREHDVQVQEVAHAVGYEDANYFSRLFRQAYGMPPSVYAKELTKAT